MKKKVILFYILLALLLVGVFLGAYVLLFDEYESMIELPELGETSVSVESLEIENKEVLGEGSGK